MAVACVALAACSGSDDAAALDGPAVTRASAVTQSVDYKCLREAVYHEAAANSLDGGRAVANVIMNRADDPRFPDTVCDVIAEGEDRGRCQFSYRCDGRSETFADGIKLANASQAAKQALENPDEDVSNGALYFHARWMKPGWFGTLTRTVTLGGNIFYAE